MFEITLVATDSSGLSDRETVVISVTEFEQEFVLAGRGQDLLLVVNPEDESSLRIANSYQELRNIPDNNIVFVTPPTRGQEEFVALNISEEEFFDFYVDPISQAINERELSSQIDFIALLGQSESYRVEGTDQTQSLSYGLLNLPQFTEGSQASDLILTRTGISVEGGNEPIRSSTVYDNIPFSADDFSYYISGVLGYTGQFGNTTDEVIRSLEASVAADGTNPQGTIFFEENDLLPARTAPREFQWPRVQAELERLGIPFVENQDSDADGGTPLNQDAVRGVVAGQSDLILPNGSTYLGGSWADNLTSFGGNFTSPNQTKATDFIAAGAAGSSGTVAEPTNGANRFPSADIFLFSEAGNTLGESFYKSVQTPDLIQFFGDLLGQAYADIPAVQIVNAPAEFSSVGGGVEIAASATLNDPRSATGIDRIELFIDGVFTQSVDGSEGEFTIDTTQLNDGVHELRLVAITNAESESEGIAIRNVVVNNNGRQVVSEETDLSGLQNEIRELSVSASGEGLARIELRHLGRLISSVDTSSSDPIQLPLDLSELAIGDNRIVPVAVYSDSSEVAGTSININVEPVVMPGATPISGDLRTPGVLTEYFFGQGGSTLAELSFDGDPDITETRSTARLGLGSQFMGTESATTQIDQLAIRLSGNFEVSEEQAGEFYFTSWNSSDTAQLFVNGVEVLSYDAIPIDRTRTDTSASVFLGPGQHSFEFLVGNEGVATDEFGVDLRVRDSSGETVILNESFIYT